MSSSSVLQRMPTIIGMPVLLGHLLTLSCSTLDIVGWSEETESVPSTDLGGDTGHSTLSGGSNMGGAESDPPDADTMSGGSTPDSNPRNILEERIDVSIDEVDEKVIVAFEQLFFGDPTSEAVYREEEDGTAYIEDVYHEDVRTDTMGYGMMVAVQLDKIEVFNKLWSWAKLHMLNTTGDSEGLLNWRCDTDGGDCSLLAATDSMSMLATTLFLAASRWGASNEHNYLEDAHSLVDAMTQIEERNGGTSTSVFNCFDLENKLPRRDSTGIGFAVPVDFLMPAFYELWAKKRPQESEFWLEVADNSRKLLNLASHPLTGLYPETITYDGFPFNGELDYRANTSRTLFNLAVDNSEFGPFDWVSEQNARLLDFFLAQGLNQYAAEYSLEGEALVTFNTPAHRSMVALAAGTSLEQRHDAFLLGLMDEAVPSGRFRYFDGMLYLLSLVSLSGQFQLN